MKYPAFQLYPGDWLKDPALGKCSAATRGIWIDLICAMHENRRSGTISGTISELARIARAHCRQMRAAIEELTTTETASVTINLRGAQGGDMRPVNRCSGNIVYTITNRRMAREYETARSNANRQDRFRKKKAEDGEYRSKKDGSGVTEQRSSNGGVTSPSSSSNSSSVRKPFTTSTMEDADPAWQEFVSRGVEVGMRASPAELAQLWRRIWRKMSLQERQEAIDGIDERVKSGEYADPAWSPTFAMYLRETRWERPLRPEPKSVTQRAQSRGDPTVSKREQGLRDFRRRLMSEMEDTKENAGLIHRTGSG